MKELERENLRKWLINTRKKKRLTQQELSLETGISVNAIRNIEQGQRYGSNETWDKIYKVLGNPNDPVEFSGKIIRVKVNVHTGMVGSDNEDYIEFYESEFEGMNEKEKADYIEKQAFEQMLSLITWHWEIENEVN